MPQAWPVVAVARRYAAGYLDEYARAWRTASPFLAALERDGRFTVERVVNGTSAFKLRVHGISPDTLMQDWETIERGVKTWLQSGHLNNIVVEFFKPGASASSAR